MTRTTGQMVKIATHFNLICSSHTPPFVIDSYRPGHRQRSVGAFSFQLKDSDRRPVFGSGWSCKKLWKMFRDDPTKIELSYSFGDCELI